MPPRTKNPPKKQPPAEAPAAPAAPSVTLPRDAWLDLLATVAPAVPKFRSGANRTAHHCVKAVVAEGVLSLTAYDTELLITARSTPSPDSRSAPLACLLPHDVLTRILPVLPADAAGVTLTLGAAGPHLSATGCSYDVPSLPVGEFPDGFASDPAPAVALPAADLEKLLRRVAFAINPDDSVRGYSARGVALTLSDKALAAGAAPAQSFLSAAEIPVPAGTEEAGTAILPAAAVRALLKALGDAEGTCRLTLAKSSVRVETDAVALVSTLVAGKPIPFAGVVEMSAKKADRSVRVGRADLHAAFRRIAAVVDDEAMRVSCEWGDTLRLAVRGSAKGSGEVSLATPGFEGPPCATDLSPENLVPFLALAAADKALEGPLTVRLGGPDKPVLFECGDGWRVLTMPMVEG